MTSEDIRQVVDEYLAEAGLRACRSRSCVFGDPGGMATNGPCACVEGVRGAERQLVLRLGRTVRALAHEVASRRAP